MATNLVIGYGNTGRLIADELKRKGETVIIGRHGSVEQTDGFEAKTVDLLQKDTVVTAVEGVERVFVTTGLPYKLSVWKAQWPVIIDNLIAACKASDAKLIFIDNIYLYGPSPLQNPITEDHPRNPVSKKGQIRLELINKLESAMQDGVDVLIVRCADFYGPNVNSSGVTMAIDAAVAGKTAYFMGDPTTRHAYSYVPDIARAVSLLALADDTYNQTWHTPTAPAITGTELVALVEQNLGKKAKWSYLKRGSMTFMGLFVPILRELKEMMYQFEHDYVFDSTKFTTTYPDFVVTSYVEGIKNTVEASVNGKVN
jgi:nucleoside-diphosphate-sugar epimerase